MAKREDRRTFLKQSALALGGLALSGTSLPGCAPTEKKAFSGKLLGPSHKAGHLLRKGINLTPQTTEEIDVVIVGGGVAGLSAARWLRKNTDLSLCLLELENQTGGNSLSGRNEVSAFPWGAHYLPLPNNTNKDLLAFLEEEKVITGYNTEGLPIYNEYHLCFDPEERLFINGYWQEGLVPSFGVPEKDRQQIERFLSLMESMKQAKGNDGRFAFDIPLANSSEDAAFRKLDNITMQAWFESEKLDSDYLRWYVDYCCLDDFGATAAQTSAWAGIHYFAGRKAQAANSDAHRVLTWPEGNHWLTERLKEQAGQSIRTESLVYNLELKGEKVVVDYVNLQTDQPNRIIANKCIVATPQFVRSRILAKVPEAAEAIKATGFSYSPWLVANLTLKQLPPGKGTQLCWDNVLYGSSSLGYVYANHQAVEGFPEKQVITFYQPIPDVTPAARQQVYQNSYEQWAEQVITELEKAHPSIRQEIETLNVWVWGHGMIRPTPGFIWGQEREKAGQVVQNKVVFAHSDLSGISIFEEAFYQGIKAGQQVVKHKPYVTS
ncbi:MAG: NAD(P)-binding protein [Rufibacter sp.]